MVYFNDADKAKLLCFSSSVIIIIFLEFLIWWACHISQTRSFIQGIHMERNYRPGLVVLSVSRTAMASTLWKTKGAPLLLDTMDNWLFKDRLEKLVNETGLTCYQVFNCGKPGLDWRLFLHIHFSSASRKRQRDSISTRIE